VIPCLRQDIPELHKQRGHEEQVMSINIELTVEEVAALKQMTKIQDDAEAVSKAAREFLRLTRLRELKSISGRVEFQANWQELEAMELGESDFPS
jgi:hypothetical protein